MLPLEPIATSSVTEVQLSVGWQRAGWRMREVLEGSPIPAAGTHQAEGSPESSPHNRLNSARCQLLTAGQGLAWGSRHQHVLPAHARSCDGGAQPPGAHLILVQVQL